VSASGLLHDNVWVMVWGEGYFHRQGSRQASSGGRIPKSRLWQGMGGVIGVRKPGMVVNRGIKKDGRKGRLAAGKLGSFSFLLGGVERVWGPTAPPVWSSCPVSKVASASCW
jgi:hypothetical protein